MRDLKELNESGIPVEAERGRGGGVRVSQRYGLGRLHLSYAEILDLLIALSVAEKLSSPVFLKNVKAVKNKISVVMPESFSGQISRIRERVLIGENASYAVMGTVNGLRKNGVDVLNTAFFEMKCLRLKYVNSKKEWSERTIEPHYLLLNSPIWYIYAWDRRSEEVRFFRIDRIQSLEVLSERFVLHHQEVFLREIRKHFQIV